MMKRNNNIVEVKHGVGSIQLTVIRNSAEKLLKKFADDTKFMKKISFKAFKVLWQIASKDTTYFTMTSSHVKGNIHFLNTAILTYDFDMSYFRDYVNNQYCVFIIPVKCNKESEKGIMFTVPVKNGDPKEDLHFVNIGDYDIFESMTAVINKTKHAMARLVRMYLPIFFEDALDDPTLNVIVDDYLQYMINIYYAHKFDLVSSEIVDETEVDPEIRKMAAVR